MEITECRIMPHQFDHFEKAVKIQEMIASVRSSSRPLKESCEKSPSNDIFAILAVDHP